MSTIPIQFYTVTNTASAPWTYNAFSQSQTGVGTLSADLKDADNISTGYSFEIINAFGGAGGSAATSTSGADVFPEATLDYFWYVSTANSPARLRIGNLTNGSAYSIKCIGHTGSNPTRDTDFTVGITTTRYDNSGNATPSGPITITGSVSGTELDIDVSSVDSYGYVNSLEITITEPSGPTITDIDSDDNVQAGQTGVTVTGTGFNTITAGTLGGETITINSNTSTTVDVDIPLHIDLEWGSATNQLSLTDSVEGAITLENVTLSTPAGWETATLSSLPDTATTESFYELSQTDSGVGNFTAATSDIIAFESQTGLTVDTQSIPTVSPPATVSGAYKWWDDSLSTWTSVSSFTVNDSGVFGANRILKDIKKSILNNAIKTL